MHIIDKQYQLAGRLSNSLHPDTYNNNPIAGVGSTHGLSFGKQVGNKWRIKSVGSTFQQSDRISSQLTVFSLESFQLLNQVVVTAELSFCQLVLQVFVFLQYFS